LLAQTSGSFDETIVVAGDALSLLGIAGFLRAGATGKTNSEPMRDQSKCMLVGEGAVAVLLRGASHAMRHDQTPVLIRGVGLSCDAGHPTQPDPTGRYLEICIRDAMQVARISPSSVVGIVAHATGTRANDLVEAEVIRRIWGDNGVAVTAVKANTGHLMGAAGLLNIAVGYEAIRTSQLPPSLGQREPLLGIDLVMNRPRPISSEGLILCLCSGFGGNNVAILLGGP
jgi:3-oxoacyl-[acyl-carrier-protein] synthase II